MSGNNIHKIDAAEERLGRLAAKVAVLLRGKHKSGFLRHQDLGDSVEVFNIEKIRVTGKKMKQKIYWHHSGYPGGLTGRSLGEKFKKDPAGVFRQAVLGMLSKNRTRAKIIKRLKIYKGEKNNE